MRNRDLYVKIKSNWDNLIKPLDGLGDFEEISSLMGAVACCEELKFKYGLIVYCADNGVVDEGISQSDQWVTLSVTKLLGTKSSSVCHMARAAGVEVFPVNLGVKYDKEVDGVDNSYYISPSTKNFALEKAMTKEQCQTAIDAGKKMADKLFNSGINCILLGEMGIGNTTTSAAVVASILGLEAKDVCGRGAGLSDQGLEKKIKVISSAIEKYDLKNASPLDVLQSVGGFDIAAMVGTILRASQLGCPAILDGLITAAAALIAVAIDPDVKDILFFSHKGREKAILLVADYLGKKPIIDGNLALGEGTGAVMFVSTLNNALSVYHGNTTFDDAKVEAYRRFS